MRAHPTDPGLRDLLFETGRGAGLERIGVATADPFESVRAALIARRQDGLSGGLTFTYNDPSRSTDIGASFPWAAGLVVGGLSYLPDAGSPGPPVPGRGRIARFSVFDAYRPLRVALEVVAGTLVEAGYRAEVVSDDNRLVDRAAAVRAGVGWWGKNSMVLAPGQGPWMLLGSVVTDADLEPTPPMERDCGTCDACLPACPTGALIAPGVLDARLCLAAIAQLPGSIPVELRPAMSDRIYGCDDCLDACPPGGRMLERSVEQRGLVDLVWLLGAGDQELRAEFGRFYMPGRRPNTLRRNALVALGNHGEARHRRVIAGYLSHDDPVLGEHAAWALDQLDARGK